MIIYGTYIIINNVYKTYELLMFSKGVIHLARKKLKDDVIYYIQDEIWEVVDKEEMHIFNDYIHI